MRDKFGLSPKNWYIEKFYAVKKEVFDLYKEDHLQDANEPVTSDNEGISSVIKTAVYRIYYEHACAALKYFA